MTPSQPTAVRRPHELANMRQTLMEGGTEVLGPLEAERLFARLNGAPDGGLSPLHSLLQADYGQRGGQGTALRLGRASFRSAAPGWAAVAGLEGAAFRLLPSPRRIHATLLALDRLLGSPVSLSEDERAWTWSVADCPACRGRSAESPDCHWLAGVLQEALAWAGGGRPYRVGETECAAAGAPECRFRIEKRPLD